MRKTNIKIFNIQYSILLFFVFYYSFFAVVPVFAETKPAEQNPMCWTLENCENQWKALFPDGKFNPQKNWESPGPNNTCGSAAEKLGVCIPAGKTSLEISLPTLKTTTADLGDYIKAIYIFLISIGGIVAAVLIIKGGFEWVTSAGSPERVKSAQTTIGSALMGLLLLLGSYTLLFTINPDLVRLRLPGVYMIKPTPLEVMAEGEYCRTEGPLKTACGSLGQAGEYVCRPLHTDGPGLVLIDSFVGVVVAGMMPGSGAIGKVVLKVGAKAGNWVLEKTAQAGSKYIGYFFKKPAGEILQAWRALTPSSTKIPVQLTFDFIEKEAAKDTTGLVLKNFGKAVATTLKGGKQMVGGVIVGGAAAGGSYLVSKKVYQILKGKNEPGYPGICDKSHQLPEGSFCNVLNPDDCESRKCVEVEEFGNWVEGLKLGVCSAGGIKTPCNLDKDCSVGQCINKSCSDGSFGTTCETYSDCQVGLDCLTVSLGRKECASVSPSKLGGPCSRTAKSGESNSCDAGLECIFPADWKVTNDGVCTDKKVGSSCYFDDDCNSDDLSIKREIKCMDSIINKSGGQYFKAGQCMFIYYNTTAVAGAPGNKVALQDSYPLSEILCSSNNNCPNAFCYSHEEKDKYCANSQ